MSIDEAKAIIELNKKLYLSSTNEADKKKHFDIMTNTGTELILASDNTEARYY